MLHLICLCSLQDLLPFLASYTSFLFNLLGKRKILVCGIDEAGRGCLCGSLFMCGVLGIERDLGDIGIKDSKKLSQKQRQNIATKLQAIANEGKIRYFITQKSATDIDALGLSVCLKQSLQEIIAFFSKQESSLSTFIYDGNTTFGLQIAPPHSLQTLIKGDSKNLLIGAASILAKVAKDNEMLLLDSLYPQYKLKNNKGYGTKTHLQAILEFGYTKEHRKSFAISQSK